MKMSDKERLENIVAVDGQGNVLIKGEDFHWLLEQAKRVELLERENKALNDMLTTLEKQDITKLLNQNVRLIKQNKRYREALEFYADEEHYKEKLISGAQYDADGICISNDKYAPPIIYFDRGETARQALDGE